MTNTNSTETTKQRIFIKGVEHAFRIGQKVRIRDTAILDRTAEKRGDSVTIREYAPLSTAPGYLVAPHGGWYEERELEALPEAITPDHGLKVGDIVIFNTTSDFQGWNGYKLAKEWGFTRFARFRVKIVPEHGKSVVLDTPFSSGKGTGCKVKRIRKSAWQKKPVTEGIDPRPVLMGNNPRMVLSDEIVKSDTFPIIGKKPASEPFFLVMSEENEPGGTFSTYAEAWEAAAKLAKEPKAVPQYIFEVKGKVKPVVKTTVETETTVY